MKSALVRLVTPASLALCQLMPAQSAPAAPDSVVAKIREVGREVFVVVLSREEGGYAFEDINSPDAASYAKLKPLPARSAPRPAR